MKETSRICKLFDDLYQGNPWIDVNLRDTLADIHAREASVKIYSNCNSIWQIVNHLIQWRMNLLQRVQGIICKSPDDNYIEPVEDKSENAWRETLEKLERSQKTWIDFLKSCKDEDLESLYPGNNMSNYEQIQGIVQHDAYHLGQIIIFKKIIRQIGT